MGNQKDEINNMNLKKFMTEEQREYLERKVQAMKIFDGLRRRASVSYHCDLIRRLHFYLDFEFVKDELIKLYRKTKYEAIKETIASLHDGTVDVSDYISEAEHYAELEAFAREIDQEHEEGLKQETLLEKPINAQVLKAILRKI